MKNYTAPALTAYGDVATITKALFSGEADDTFFDLSGQAQPGSGISVDACEVPDGEPVPCDGPL